VAGSCIGLKSSDAPAAVEATTVASISAVWKYQLPQVRALIRLRPAAPPVKGVPCGELELDDYAYGVPIMISTWYVS
jgi:hypothetical protein